MKNGLSKGAIPGLKTNVPDALRIILVNVILELELSKTYTFGTGGALLLLESVGGLASTCCLFFKVPNVFRRDEVYKRRLVKQAPQQGYKQQHPLLCSSESPFSGHD